MGFIVESRIKREAWGMKTRAPKKLNCKCIFQVFIRICVRIVNHCMQDFSHTSDVAAVYQSLPFALLTTYATYITYHSRFLLILHSLTILRAMCHPSRLPPPWMTFTLLTSIDQFSILFFQGR